MADVRVVNLPETVGFAPVEGAMMRGIVGDGAMINLVDLAPDSLVPLHSHPHVQIGYVVEGVMIMEIDGAEYEMPPGTAYTIPGDVMHSGRGGPDGCRVIDVFVPVREDYVERLEEAASG